MWWKAKALFLQSFLSRCVESNIKQHGKQWKWSQSTGELSCQSGQRMMEWVPVCWNCWEHLRMWGRRASWMADLPSCVWKKVEKCCWWHGAHLPLLEYSHLPQRKVSAALWNRTPWDFFLQSTRMYMQRDKLGEQACSHTKEFFFHLVN